MDNDKEWIAFSGELRRRFEEFTDWTIANWPDKSRPLSAASFSRSRDEIAGLMAGQAQAGGGSSAEPSEGGPQYVSVTPSPWP
jgi:hypothetical protein